MKALIKLGVPPCRYYVHVQKGERDEIRQSRWMILWMTLIPTLWDSLLRT